MRHKKVLEVYITIRYNLLLKGSHANIYERDGKMEKRKSSYLSRYGLAFLMVAVLFLAMQMMVHATDEDGSIGTATVKAGKQNVNVRSKAVDGGSVAHVSGGDSFSVLGSVNGSDGYVWYEISGTSGGATIHGYIREDMVDFTEAEPAEDNSGDAAGAGAEPDTPSDGGGDQTPETTSTMGSILAMDPPANEDGSIQTPTLPAGFEETRIRVGDREVQAWEKDDTFYIFYANSPSGNVGWFLYDSAEGRWVRYIDFLLETGNTATETKTGGGVSKGVVIALIVMVIILAVVCALMAYKLFAGKDYDDDDDDDDDDDYRPRRQQASSRPSQQGSAASRPVQSRPQGGAGAPGQRPAGQRPAGQVQRPAGAQGQRPAGQRPAGAPGQRPAGQRPAGQVQHPAGSQPVRRQSQPGAPVTRRSTQGGPTARPQGVRQSRPVDDDEDE